ncbi:MAG: V-type proton ATPase subunit E [Candidatus Moduliflexus flocculans]|nr:V-type proton ATPase subunit E [Candidatus Moduliflexus flocculans]
MEEELEEERNLLAGIAREADRKAAEIEEEAASYARTRAEAARTQAREILRKAEETAAAQCESVRRNAESRAAVEARKTSLRIRDRLIQDTLDAARRVVAEAEDRPGYRGGAPALDRGGRHGAFRPGSPGERLPGRTAPDHRRTPSRGGAGGPGVHRQARAPFPGGGRSPARPGRRTDGPGRPACLQQPGSDPIPARPV